MWEQRGNVRVWSHTEKHDSEVRYIRLLGCMCFQLLGVISSGLLDGVPVNRTWHEVDVLLGQAVE
jgi:hypothetical protein